MAIDITTNKHNVAFPSKVKSSICGHIYNLVLLANADNGELFSKGDYVSFDNYKAAAAPVNFAGIIREQARNGNWYVEVTEPAGALFAYNSPVSPYSERELQDEALFFNKTGDVVQGMELSVGDMVELSETAFNGTPVANKAVSYASKKYVVAS